LYIVSILTLLVAAAGSVDSDQCLFSESVLCIRLLSAGSL